VFKQRTAPLAAARYQEDYYLAILQLDAVRKAGICPEWKFPEPVPPPQSGGINWKMTVVAATAVAVAVYLAWAFGRKHENI
jgi:hypothetical protein